MAEFRVGNLFFTSNFNSGNLARVEKVVRPGEEEENVNNASCYNVDVRPDYEVNVWTSPDCAGTPFENGNRSWFYFGVRGYGPSKIIKINIMNMNRQGKLYSQGHSPFTKTVPGKPRWERTRDRPTWETIEGQFILSFTHRFLEFRGATTYFAFCYPWSYTESQQQLEELDQKFDRCKSLPFNPPEDEIYYHRELLCHSLQKQRVDLITISSCHGIQPEREPHFDKHLFPDKHTPRCHRFKGKRVYFLSSRVHPGETPASFVFNGFLDFILREDDKRAVQLRKLFVFKLIPLLNPDGVTNGHYRTDTRGVNLNRLYQDPDFKMQPSIYAAKSVIVYHHIVSRVKAGKNFSSWSLRFPGGFTVKVEPEQHCTSKVAENFHKTKKEELLYEQATEEGLSNTNHNAHPHSLPTVMTSLVASDKDSVIKPVVTHNPPNTDAQEFLKSRLIVEPLDLSELQSSVEAFVSAGKGNNHGFSSSDSSILSANEGCPAPHVNQAVIAQMGQLSIQEKNPLHLSLNRLESDSEEERIGNEGSDEDENQPIISDSCIFAPHLSDPNLLTISPEESGIAFYLDLHGHASKRGCFIYGNYLENEDLQVENMLYPKLISINTAHFDFTGCNFTERNMYMRDKRDGMSKEGSGRVAIYKSIGLIHSYTLECNYNTGRMLNTVPPASGDNGRATPPPQAGFPPKYTTAMFEDVGKAAAVAALDVMNCNPWSRVTLSEHSCLQGVRDAVRRYLRGLRGGPRIPRTTSKTMTRSGSLSSTNLQTGSKTTQSSTTSSSVKGTPTRRASLTNNPTTLKRELAPVREANRPIPNPRRRMTIPSCATKVSNQPKSEVTGNKGGSVTAQMSTVPLAMTTLASDQSIYQQTPESSAYNMEDDRLEKLRSVRLAAVSNRQKPTSRIPVLVNRSVLQLSDTCCLEGNLPTHIDKYTERFHQPIKLSPNKPSQTLHQAGLHSSHTGELLPFREQTGCNSAGHKQEKRPKPDATFSLPVTLPTTPQHGMNVEPPKTDPPRRKTRRLSQLLKRRSVSHSPKSNYWKGSVSKTGSGNESETDRKPRRRRKKSRRKSSVVSPSSDDVEPAPLLPDTAIQGSVVPLSPRNLIGTSELFLPFPSKYSGDRHRPVHPLDETHLNTVNPEGIGHKRSTLASKLSVYLMDL